MIIVPDQGKIALNKMLQNALCNAAPPLVQATIRLFTACATAGGVPAFNSVDADLTEVVGVTGYAAQNLATPADQGINGSDQDRITFAAVTFPNPSAGSASVLGYWVRAVISATNTIMWAELFPAAVAYSNGNPITFTPAICLGQI